MRRLTVSLFALTALAACSDPGTAGAPAPCAGKCDGPPGAAVLAEVARCWLEAGSSSDPFYRQDALVCEPIRSPYARINFLSVDVITADRDVAGGVLRGDFGKQTVAVLNDRRYPAEVKLSLNLLRGQDELVGANLVGQLQRSFTLADKNALPRSKAVSVTVPLPIWPVRVLARVDQLIATLDPYQATLADGWRLEGASEIQVGRSTLPRVRRDQLVSFTLVGVPAGKAIAASGMFVVGYEGRQPRSFTIDAPGDYVAELAGLRPAMPGELPAPLDLGGALDGGVLDGASTDGGDVDLAPVAPVDLAQRD